MTSRARARRTESDDDVGGHLAALDGLLVLLRDATRLAMTALATGDEIALDRAMRQRETITAHAGPALEAVRRARARARRRAGPGRPSPLERPVAHVVRALERIRDDDARLFVRLQEHRGAVAAELDRAARVHAEVSRYGGESAPIGRRLDLRR